MDENTEKLKELHKITNIDYYHCKQALRESDYDLQKALELLQKKINPKDKFINKENKIGVVRIGKSEDKIIAFVLTCQTDFTSASKKFQDTAEKVERILLDNFSHLYKKSNWELPLAAQELLSELKLATNENIGLDKCRLFLKESHERVGIYLHHNQQSGALVLIQGENNNNSENIADELAIQIVASNPQYLSLNEVPKNFLEKEKKIFLDQAKEKNPHQSSEIIEKVVQGKLKKFLESICFLEQNDFRDTTVKIKDYLAKNRIKVNNFYLLSIT